MEYIPYIILLAVGVGCLLTVLRQYRERRYKLNAAAVVTPIPKDQLRDTVCIIRADGSTRLSRGGIAFDTRRQHENETTQNQTDPNSTQC